MITGEDVARFDRGGAGVQQDYYAEDESDDYGSAVVVAWMFGALAVSAGLAVFIAVRALS